MPVYGLGGLGCANYVTSTTTSTNIIWDGWIQYANQTTSATTIWANWTSTGTSTCTGPQYSNMVALNAEQVALYQQQQAAQQAAYTAHVEQRTAADAKAWALLREHLTPKQREALDKHKWFLVEGGKSKKTYRIDAHKCAGNIVEVKGKKDVAKYCVHADYQIPLGDQLLAQTLSLMHDEDHIIARANKTALAA